MISTTLLLMMCHFTNYRRKTVQQGYEDVEMVSKGCSTEVLGDRQVDREGEVKTRD
jgi:hypothetical protein